MLSHTILLTSTVWQIENCKKKNLAVRTGDDGYYCDPPFAESSFSCELFYFLTGGASGYYAGDWIVQNIPGVPNWGAIPGIGFLLGAYLLELWDPFNCKPVCDDCHQPDKIRLQADYFNCQFTGAQWFGHFEYAEGWEYSVNAASGNFSGSTILPRTYFPSQFDPNGQSFRITVRTICDGGYIPYPFNFSTLFSSTLPPAPLSIRGKYIVNREDDFTYTSSTSFGGNLSNPSWEVDEGVEVLSTGSVDDKFYIIVNFADVTAKRADIVLTVYDACTNANESTIFIARLEHE